MTITRPKGYVLLSTVASDVRGGGLATTPVTVSVVICCCTERRWDDIIAAVESVRHQTVLA
jgi:hypothetical protein